jgi:hypothetical protein
MIRQVAATPAETADRVHAALQAKAIGDVDVGATLVVAQCAPRLRAPTRGRPYTRAPSVGTPVSRAS